MASKTSETKSPLPSFEELEHLARTAERHRIDVAKKIGPIAHRHASSERTKTEATQERQQFKDRIVSQIKQEAQQVADKLTSAGVESEITIRRHRNLSPNRRLRFADTVPLAPGRTRFRDYYRHKGSVEKEGELRGWLLTPPQELKHNQNAHQNGRHHNPNVVRTGLALGEDGNLYTYRHKGAVKEDMVVVSNLDILNIVRPEQIVNTASGLNYVDRIADSYSHPALPADYVPRPGEDNTALIHGLGVREALAALSLQADQAIADNPSPPNVGWKRH